MRLLDRYEEIVGHQEVERLRRLAERLAGKRIVHVNSTRSGGGVAEILGWMVPLMEELGIDAHWEVITGPPDFYPRHQGLSQRLAGPARVAEEERFRSALRGQSGERRAAEPRRPTSSSSTIRSRSTCRSSRRRGQVGRWIWRCHIDASRPQSRRVEVPGERPIADYDAAIFSMPAFARPLACPMFLIPPSIDPLSDKNCADSRGRAAGDAGPAGHRPGAAAAGAGLAVRSLQGPVGRDRGLSPAEALLPGNAVGLGRRTGRRRPGRGRGAARGARAGRATTRT